MSNRETGRELVVTGVESDELGRLTSLLSETEGFGIETVPAWDLTDHLAETDPSALVVVDDPPASDGIEIFDEVRDTGATQPIVLVGTNVAPSRVEAAISAGVTDYITTGGDTLVTELTARLRAHISHPAYDGFVEARRWAAVIGSLAHDVKNPLNVVSGRLELLDIEDTHADAINRSIRRVESLIDEVSVVASAATTDRESEAVALASKAQSVWSGLDTGSATLTVETDRRVADDGDCVGLLFGRLFENALQHGGEDVTVTVGHIDDGFYIADDGDGLPAEDRNRVFEQGYGTARYGDGYGLFVASRVAAANGWEITAGESADGGARFDVQSR